MNGTSIAAKWRENLQVTNVSEVTSFFFFSSGFRAWSSVGENNSADAILFVRFQKKESAGFRNLIL